MPGFQQNVSRTLVGGHPNEIGGNLRDLGRAGAPPTLFRAVVLEVLSDTGSLSGDDMEGLKSRVSNPDFVDMMPPNCVIAQLVSGGQEGNVLPTLLYPFFQSHISLPVMAGEHVFVVFEDFQQHGAGFGRWMTRVHESSAVEDLNFTHSDRRFNADNVPTQERTSTSANRQQTTPPRPSFPNGGGTNDSFTLPPSGSVNPYDSIFRESQASRLHSYEAVPRYTKRPQELVIQGMHNTLLVFGQDRVGPATRVTGSQQTDQTAYAGAVDLVVGRGRFPLTEQNNAPVATKPTSPLVVNNTRDKTEVDKVTHHRNRVKNPREGDPDFSRDAARLYLSMNTKGDTNFGLLHGTGDGKTDFADNTLRKKEQGNGSEPRRVSERTGNSYGILKADHLRLVARKATAPDGGTIKGSVLIVREGTKDEDLAYIYINSDGLLQLDAKRIFLGKAVTGATPDAADHAEPYIKWTKFKETVDNLHAEIDFLKTQMAAMITILSAQSAASVCVPFAPDPAWTAVAPGLAPVTTALNSGLTPLKTATDAAVTASKSTQVFGI